jgi:hypothetical protein
MITLTGVVIEQNDTRYWKLHIGDLVEYNDYFYGVINNDVEIGRTRCNIIQLDHHIIKPLKTQFINELFKRGLMFTKAQYFNFVGLSLKGMKLKEVNKVLVKDEGVPNTFKEAIKLLEELGNFVPSLASILAIMGKEVEFLPWYDMDKNVRGFKSLTFSRNDSQNTPPLIGECFEESYGFKLISSSEKRMIFTNRKYYIVDTPYYGHALYIFPSLNSAQEWAENKVSAETAMKKAVKRIIHVEGTWKHNLAIALQQLQ